SGSNCFVTFILPEGALFVYQSFAEQSIILNLKQKRNPVSTEFLFCYLTEFCPSLHSLFNNFPLIGKQVTDSWCKHRIAFPFHINKEIRIQLFTVYLAFAN